MSMSEVIQGVRSYVVDHSKVRKSENVLVGADVHTDPVVVDTIASFCRADDRMKLVSHEVIIDGG